MNNSATGDMVTVLGALDSLTLGSQIDQSLNSLLPNTDNSATQTTQATLDQFLSTVFAHLDAIKNVTTSALKGQDVWTSGYGSYIHQDPMGTSNGYNATIWGTALGYDFPALDNLRVGLSGGFAQDFVRTKDSSARNNINSYQGTLYGSYAKDAYYVDTAFSFAYNTYDASRHVAVGTIDRTATGDYNGQQYSAYIGGGYKFTGKNIELTPLASFQYTHLRLNSYTESGAGAAGLNIDAQDYDVAQTGLGMKFGYPVTLKSGIGRLTPELKFKWLYDWVGDAQQATSTFTGGGGSFDTQGFKPAQSSYDFGAKLILETTSFITVSLSYDLELKENFYGHYGLAEVRYRF
jgi:outer membrane autotransporter protein